MTHAEIFDVIIVGMGVFGSATAYQLSVISPSLRVLCLEQFNVTPEIHPNGSSHGHSRIIRFSYEDEIYSLMGIESLQQWRNIEKETKTELYTQTGGLDFGSESHHMMQTVIDVARKNKLEHEILNAEQIKKRFPAFNTSTFQNDYIGLYQKDAGILNAAECVAALQILALRNKNITLRDHQQVVGIWDIGKQHEVAVHKTNGERYTVIGNKIVLCLGAWTGSFLKKQKHPLNLELNIIQTSYGFWKVADEHENEYQLGKLPLWIHWGRYFDFLHPEDAVHVRQYSNEQDLAYFGFPIFEKPKHFKAGIHYNLQNDRLEDPIHDRNFTMPERKIKIMKQYLAQNFVGMNYIKNPDIPFIYETCLYTTSRTDDFVIDTHPNDDSIVICGACNGHAFKFAPLIGRMATELLQDPKRNKFSLNLPEQRSDIDREKFSIQKCIANPTNLQSKL